MALKRLTDLASQLALLHRRGASIGVDFKFIADHLNLHVSVKDPELRYRYINMPGQVNHLLPGSLQGQLSDADLIGQDVASWRVQADRLALRSRDPHIVWSEPQPGPDGHAVRQPQVKIGLHDERGMPAGVLDLAPVGDDVEHMRMEVQRLREALDLVTEVLGLLMRHDHETDLLERVCSTLVVKGRYLAAAVVPVESSKRTVHVPLCQAGNRAELCLPGPFRLDDPIWETHPLVRTVESGICMVQRLNSAREHTLWQQAHPPEHAQALIALPLNTDDDVHAVLLLACDGVDSFAPSRAVLLQRMADELSLGLELLRSRQRLATERQQKELHLRQQLATSQRLNLATHSGQVGLWEWDLARNTVVLDEQATAQLGLPSYARTLPLNTVLGWIHADDHPGAVVALDQVRHEGLAVDTTMRIIPPDGRERVQRVCMAALRQEDGTITGVLGANLDITDPTRDMERLQHLGTKLQLATQATGLGIWELDLVQFRMLLDGRACQIHGLDEPQSVVSWQTWLQWVHPAQRQEVHDQFSRGLREASQGQFECALTPPDQRPRRLLVNWASQANEEGQVQQLLGTLVDLTERRRSEARTAQTHQRLALLAGATGVGHWRYDLQEGFHFDEPMLRLLGVHTTPPPATAWLMEMCLNGTQREALELALITADEQLEVALQWQGLDGVNRRVIWLGTVDRDSRRTVTRAEGLCIDVTMQHQLEEARQREAQGQRADRSALVSRISQELRSPLNAMLGFVQLLRRSGSPERLQQFDDYMAQVEQAGWHMLEMVNDVMDLSSLESGSTPLDIETVSLVDLMGELLPLIEQLASVQHVRIDLRELGAWPSVRADRRLLKQALVNVASHGIQRTPAYGTVTLAFEPFGHEVAIRVIDEGLPLTPMQVGAMLDPYGALQEAALNDKEPHQGMRLAISRQALESIGGHLRIDNGPDSPVALSLVLPRAEPLMDTPLPVPARAMADEAVQVNPHTRGRVLYVEDNPSNVLLVREFLSLRPGVALEVAHNVAEGLAAVAGQRFDCVLLDLQLPDGDGYEVLQALRSQRHATPCVALTANAMINERNRALEAGFEAFWTKPLNLPEFLQGLDLWLSTRRSRAEA